MAGAFRDNRVIPYEGAPVSEFNKKQKQAVVNCVSNFISYLPKGPLAAKLQQIRDHIDESRSCAGKFWNAEAS